MGKRLLSVFLTFVLIISFFGVYASPKGEVYAGDEDEIIFGEDSIGELDPNSTITVGKKYVYGNKKWICAEKTSSTATLQCMNGDVIEIWPGRFCDASMVASGNYHYDYYPYSVSNKNIAYWSGGWFDWWKRYGSVTVSSYGIYLLPNNIAESSHYKVALTEAAKEMALVSGQSYGYAWTGDPTGTSCDPFVIKSDGTKVANLQQNKPLACVAPAMKVYFSKIGISADDSGEFRELKALPDALKVETSGRDVESGAEYDLEELIGAVNYVIAGIYEESAAYTVTDTLGWISGRKLVVPELTNASVDVITVQSAYFKDLSASIKVVCIPETAMSSPVIGDEEYVDPVNTVSPGEIYSFGGYDWICAEQSGNTATLQSLYSGVQDYTPLHKIYTPLGAQEAYSTQGITGYVDQNIVKLYPDWDRWLDKYGECCADEKGLYLAGSSKLQTGYYKIAMQCIVGEVSSNVGVFTGEADSGTYACYISNNASVARDNAYDAIRRVIAPAINIDLDKIYVTGNEEKTMGLRSSYVSSGISTGLGLSVMRERGEYDFVDRLSDVEYLGGTNDKRSSSYIIYDSLGWISGTIINIPSVNRDYVDDIIIISKLHPEYEPIVFSIPVEADEPAYIATVYKKALETYAGSYLNMAEYIDVECFDASGFSDGYADTFTLSVDEKHGRTDRIYFFPKEAEEYSVAELYITAGKAGGLDYSDCEPLRVRVTVYGNGGSSPSVPEGNSQGYYSYTDEESGITWYYRCDGGGRIAYLYTENKDLSSITGDSGALLIPSYINGCKVIAIGCAASENRSFIPADAYGFSSVQLPANIETIEAHAFENVENGFSIRIPDKVTYIGAECFKNSGLTSLFIENNEELCIETEAFADTSSLSDVVLEGGKLSLKNGVFRNATGLKTLYVNTEDVGNGWFTNTAALERIAFGPDTRNVAASWNTVAEGLPAGTDREIYVMSSDTAFELRRDFPSPFGEFGTTVVYCADSPEAFDQSDIYDESGDSCHGTIPQLFAASQIDSGIRDMMKGSLNELSVSLLDKEPSLTEIFPGESGIDVKVCGITRPGEPVEKSIFSVYRTYIGIRNAELTDDEYSIKREGTEEDVDIIATPEECETGAVRLVVCTQDENGEPLSVNVRVPVVEYTEEEKFLKKYGSYDAVESQLAQLELDIAGLHATIAQKNEEIAELSEALAGKNSDIEELRQLISDRQAALSEAEAQLADKEAALSNAEAQLTDKEAALSDAESQLAEKEAALSEAESQLSEKEAALREAESQLSEKEAALREAESQLSEKEAALREAEAQLAEKESAIGDAGSQLAEKEAQLSDKEAALDEAQAQLAEMNAEISGLNDRIAGLREEIEGLNGTIEELNKAVAEKDDVIAGKDETIAGLNGQIADQEGVIAGKDETIAGLNGQIADQEGVIAGKDETIAGLNGQIAEQEGVIAGKDETIAGLNDSIGEKDALLAEYESRLCSALLAAEQMLSEAEDARTEADELRESLNTVTERYNTLLRELKGMFSEGSENPEGENTAESVKALLLSRFNAMKDSLMEADAEILALRGELEGLRGENAQLQEQNTDLQNMNTQLQDKNTQLQENNEALAGELAAGNAEISGLNAEKAAMSEEISGLRDEKAAMSEEISGLQNEKTAMSEEISGLRGDNESLIAETYSVRSENSRLKEEAQSAIGENIRLTLVISDKNAVIEEKDGRIRELENEISLLREQLESLKQREEEPEIIEPEPEIKEPEPDKTEPEPEPEVKEPEPEPEVYEPEEEKPEPEVKEPEPEIIEPEPEPEIKESVPEPEVYGPEEEKPESEVYEPEEEKPDPEITEPEPDIIIDFTDNTVSRSTRARSAGDTAYSQAQTDQATDNSEPSQEKLAGTARMSDVEVAVSKTETVISKTESTAPKTEKTASKVETTAPKTEKTVLKVKTPKSKTVAAAPEQESVVIKKETAVSEQAPAVAINETAAKESTASEQAPAVVISEASAKETAAPEQAPAVDNKKDTAAPEQESVVIKKRSAVSEQVSAVIQKEAAHSGTMAEVMTETTEEENFEKNIDEGVDTSEETTDIDNASGNGTKDTAKGIIGGFLALLGCAAFILRKKFF